MNSFEALALTLHNKIRSETKESIEQGTVMISQLNQQYSIYTSIISNALSSKNNNPYHHTSSSSQESPFQSNSLQETHFLNNKRLRTFNDKTPSSVPISQTVKNRKKVYCHSDTYVNDTNVYQNYAPIHPLTTLSNIYHNDNNNEELTRVNTGHSNKSLNRGSIYRGVSRNGSQWQVLIMINKKKKYIGSYSEEELAAKAYDVVALRNHGKKAKTNFFYTEQEIEQIVLREL